MAASSDSEDESFVELGKPLPYIEEEGKKKPISLQDAPRSSQDSKGRPRFHGAFTGGFSAGYFNSVGSKEGWTPSVFVSSRQKKQETTTQRPEDFMDDDDLGEHGIAPRHFATSDAFSSEEQNRKRRAEAMMSTRDSILPASAALADLVVPEKLPIGIKLLRKMGWKEGQGVGPRVKKKKKKKEKDTGEPGVKVYGCSRPPLSDEESESEDSDIDLQNVTFAPKDVTPVCLTSKDNVHGLGYRGLDPSLALPGTGVSLFDPPAVKSSRTRKGIRGQAFGVGALEDDDPDIYAVDSMSNYDQTMEIDDSEQLFGWTAPGARSKGKGKPERVGEAPVAYVGKLLEEFTLSNKPLPPKKVFPAPTVPRGFQPFHRFKKTAEQLAQEAVGEKPAASGQRPGRSKLSAVDRGLMLDETPIATSVFDLIPKDDQRKMEAVKEAAKMAASRFHSAGTTTENNNAAVKQALPVKDALPGLMEKAAPEVGDSTSSAPLFSGNISEVQPFRKDPAKQDRYNRYLALLKKGVKDPYEDVVAGHMTEWERHREKEEFSKAAKIYRPLANMMASRFTRGAFIDDSDQQSGIMEVAQTEKSEQAKAAEMKMYGRLTREDVEWHPHNLLCKRFNIPNPYPESDIVGVPGLKKDKFSVFTFLSVPTPSFGQQAPAEKNSVPQAPETTSSLTRELNASKRKKGALSIFSVLDDDKEPPKSRTKLDTEAKETHDELQNDEDKKEDEDSDDDGGGGKDDEPLDLFKAIFKNSDSDSSSDSDKSEDEKNNDSDSDGKKSEKEKESDQEQSSQTISLPAVSPAFPEPERSSTILQLSDQHAANEKNPSSLPPSPIPTTSSKSPESRPKKRSRWGGAVSIFDVLDQPSPASPPQGARTAVEVEKRLSAPAQAEEAVEEYGPALPPPSSSVVSGSVPLRSNANAHADLTSDSHRKHKHKHRDQDRPSSKHRHKKEKKKKSKHKKEKKKKKIKRSHSDRHKDHSSGSEVDSETNSDS